MGLQLYSHIKYVQIYNFCLFSVPLTHFLINKICFIEQTIRKEGIKHTILFYVWARKCKSWAPESEWGSHEKWHAEEVSAGFNKSAWHIDTAFNFENGDVVSTQYSSSSTTFFLDKPPAFPPSLTHHSPPFFFLSPPPPPPPPPWRFSSPSFALIRRLYVLF